MSENIEKKKIVKQIADLIKLKDIIINDDQDEQIIPIDPITNHLSYFDELKDITLIEGEEYIPIIKGVWYCLLGSVLKNKKIVLGKLNADLRVHITVPLPSGQGKKNIKIAIEKITKKFGYSCHIPTSLHPEQLIGKVVNRGTIKKPEWIRNEGYLSRDFLIFDECFELFTSKDQNIKESRKNLRISKDPIGDNRVEKKSVDNLFDEQEIINYFPKQSTTSFLQPKPLTSDIVEEGDLRRDIILYVR